MKHQFRWMVLFVSSSACALIATIARASPTQEEVFKSISENVGQKTDSSRFLAGAAAVVAAAILVAVFSKRKDRVEKPKSSNHPGKLLKEVVRATSLRPAEVRYLKTLAERESIASPLTFVLCPSVLIKAARTSTARTEKKVLVQLTRKMGIALGAPRR